MSWEHNNSSSHRRTLVVVIICSAAPGKVDRKNVNDVILSHIYILHSPQSPSKQYKIIYLLKIMYSGYQFMGMPGLSTCLNYHGNDSLNLENFVEAEFWKNI